MTRKSNSKTAKNEKTISSEAQQIINSAISKNMKASQKKDDKQQNTKQEVPSKAKEKVVKPNTASSKSKKSSNSPSGERNNKKSVPKSPDYSEFLRLVKSHPYSYATVQHLHGLDLLPLANTTVERVIWKRKKVTDPMRVALLSWAEIVRQAYPQYYSFFILSLIQYTVEGMIKAGADAYHEWATTGTVTINPFYALLPGVIGKPLTEMTTCMCYPKRLSCADAEQACVLEFVQLQNDLRNVVREHTFSEEGTLKSRKSNESINTQYTSINYITSLNSSYRANYLQYADSTSHNPHSWCDGEHCYVSPYGDGYNHPTYTQRDIGVDNHVLRLGVDAIIDRYSLLTREYTVKFKGLREESLLYFMRNSKVWKTLGNDIFKWCKKNKLPIPTGSCADTGTDLHSKIRKLRVVEDAISKCRTYIQFKSLIASYDFAHCEAKLTAVPKDYKSSRLIATVPVVPQSIGMVVQQLMMEKLSKTISQKVPYHNIAICQENQEFSRQFAQAGSATELIDTIDQSHASDMVTYTNLSGIIPNLWDLHFWLIDIVPRYCRYCVNPEAKKEDRKWKVIYMETFAPAGYANTFNMESFYFAMVSSYGEHLRESFAPLTPEDIQEWEQKVGANYFIVIVGDDTACHTAFTETIMDALVNFGLIVNPTKSFTTYNNSTRFREACGGEYCMGMDVTPTYFPRKKWDFVYGDHLAIDDFTSEKPDERVSTFTSMCALARRLYGYPLAQDIVVNALLSVKPLKGNYTISDDISEIGIRSKTHLVVQYYQDAYAEIVQSTDGKRTLKSLPTPQNAEKERRFRAPKVTSSIREDYASYRSNPVNKTLPDNVIADFDQYLYEYYLCYGPDDSDELLSSLGVTIRREL